MIKELAFCAYPVQDIARAKDFYENKLGLKPSSGFCNEHWQEYEVGASTFSIAQVSEQTPPFWKMAGNSVAFEVEDLDAAVEKMKANDVPIVMGPMDFPTCRICVVQDPDENTVALHQLAKDRP